MKRPQSPLAAPRQRARRGPGREEILRYATGHCALGPILVAQSAKGVAAILIEQDEEHLLPKLRRKFPAAHLIEDQRGLKDTLKQVDRLIDDPARGLDLALDIRGTQFQQKVWRAIRAIPPGRTASYSDIAIAIGAPRAARAVGTVCALNTLAIALPCHRVLHKDGSPLDGPHWGGNRQLALIERERIAGKPGAAMRHPPRATRGTAPTVRQRSKQAGRSMD
jgi:AraC family transcriptional regulator of adaptative response/methylated-DNA-[protein]-cysteine methyltransferase